MYFYLFIYLFIHLFIYDQYVKFSYSETTPYNITSLCTSSLLRKLYLRNSERPMKSILADSKRASDVPGIVIFFTSICQVLYFEPRKILTDLSQLDLVIFVF